MELFKSRTRDDDAYKAIALLMNGFGGHHFGNNEYIAEERKLAGFKRSSERRMPLLLTLPYCTTVWTVHKEYSLRLNSHMIVR